MTKRAPPGFWQKRKQTARDLRHAPTEAEERLWAALRDKQLRGLKFRRQHPISQYVVDFYCEAHRLVVEIDGSVHRDQQQADAIRQADLEHLGLTVVRFSNDQVLTDLDSVLDALVQHCAKST